MQRCESTLQNSGTTRNKTILPIILYFHTGLAKLSVNADLFRRTVYDHNNYSVLASLTKTHRFNLRSALIESIGFPLWKCIPDELFFYHNGMQETSLHIRNVQKYNFFKFDLKKYSNSSSRKQGTFQNIISQKTDMQNQKVKIIKWTKAESTWQENTLQFVKYRVLQNRGKKGKERKHQSRIKNKH